MKIFGNIEVLLSLNTKLLEDLKNEMEGECRLGKVLLKFSPYLKMYSQYVDNYDGAMICMSEELNRNPLKAFATKIRSDPANVRKLELQSFLIMPVQRIPRYRMLMEEVLRHTTDADEDKGEIEECLEKIKKVAKDCNASIDQRENTEKLLKIQLELGGSVNVMQAHRKFIFEGDLKKQCRKDLKMYRIWLFNDVLMYGTDQGIGLGYKHHRTIALANLEVEDIPEDKAPHRFQLLGAEKSFVLEAKDGPEKSKWMKLLQEQHDIQHKLEQEKMEKTGTRKSSLTGERAAVWEADTEGNTCRACHREFSLFVRRHHCRRCGKLVCGNCSASSWLIENIDKKNKVRVCDQCLDELKKAAEGGEGGDAHTAGEAADGDGEESQDPPNPHVPPPVGSRPSPPIPAAGGPRPAPPVPGGGRAAPPLPGGGGPAVSPSGRPAPPAQSRPTTTLLRLKPHWAIAKDEEGDPYYYNEVTGETSWEPPLFDPSEGVAEKQVTPPAPPKKKDSSTPLPATALKKVETPSSSAVSEESVAPVVPARAFNKPPSPASRTDSVRAAPPVPGREAPAVPARVAPPVPGGGGGGGTLKAAPKSAPVEAATPETSSGALISPPPVIPIAKLQNLKSGDADAVGLDLVNKEVHLSDSDFQSLLGMSREEFNAMPKWKKDSKKKAAKIF